MAGNHWPTRISLKKVWLVLWMVSIDPQTHHHWLVSTPTAKKRWSSPEQQVFSASITPPTTTTTLQQSYPPKATSPTQPTPPNMTPFANLPLTAHHKRQWHLYDHPQHTGLRVDRFGLLQVGSSWSPARHLVVWVACLIAKVEIAGMQLVTVSCCSLSQ